MLKKNRSGGGASKDGYQLDATPGRARRTFSANYKLAILRIAREIRETRNGSLGAFLIREGLSTSHLKQWEKQASRGLIGKAKRGRPGKSRRALRRENAVLRQSLAAAEKRARQAEEIVRLQMKYVRGAAWKLERKDRGLLAGLLARVDRECSVSSVCEALDLTRRDFYRTIKPLIDGEPSNSPSLPASASEPS
ncbi:MAG TPA: hypothetical protein VJ385_01060 [Fibrobacteria bacterium]|nr:hypothetical protein [Fibrobacteria bacterium]